MGTELKTVLFKDALQERYLSYALSTIMSRSLPDVRDGMKPVHRRLIFAMRELHLNSKSAPKKCARIVGDVMGKFHPHGDVAIYNTLVRLAQDFSLRYPLIEGQGNFGNVDGDNAAAMRYTEARLTEVAEALMEGLDEMCVDFRTTYDGEFKEPIVFPGKFPNLLANGSEGIAVGMATSIPPHNVDELCNALIHLVDHPEATVRDLVNFVQGPDFPTHGVLVDGKESIISAYETGRGSFRLRASYEEEPLKNGQYQIVIKEIPYQVEKGKLIERLVDLVLTKKIPMLTDVQDESTDEIRIVLTPRSRSIDSAMLMSALFRHSDLEVRFSLNMNVLDSRHMPRVMSLKEVLSLFLEHRVEIVLRRTKFRLEEIAKRLATLDGYLIAYLNLDRIIQIIREEDNPKVLMMDEFKLTDFQAESILNMRLRALRKLEEMELRTEHAKLKEEAVKLNRLLGDEKERLNFIKDEFREIQKKFGAENRILGPRRTKLVEATEDVDVPLEAMVEKEPITVILSKKGWIRSFKGHSVESAEVKYKEGDEEFLTLKAETTDRILLFSTTGRFYTLQGSALPPGRGFGEPVRMLLELEQTEEILSLRAYASHEEDTYLVASSDGRGFLVKAKDVVAQTRNGKHVLTVKDGVQAKLCEKVQGDHVAVVGQNHKLVIFPLSEMPTMMRGRGVMLQRYKDGGLSDVTTFNLVDGLRWTRKNKSTVEKNLAPWLAKRAAPGRLPPPGFPRNNLFHEG